MEHLTVEEWNRDGRKVEQWNRDDGSVKHRSEEQRNRDGRTVEHLMVAIKFEKTELIEIS